MIDAFEDEVVKLASKSSMILQLIKKHKLSAPMARAALLGASVTTIQNLLGSDNPKLVRSAISGAAGGAITGAMFPTWFTRGNTLAHHIKSKA